MREENYFYIDKTKYIEILENFNSKYLFFIRPRRFGKSLFLSTIEHYYDLNQREEFENLFSGLYIGDNPTKLKNESFIYDNEELREPQIDAYASVYDHFVVKQNTQDVIVSRNRLS